MKKVLKRHNPTENIVTDGLRSYPEALKDLSHVEHHGMERHLVDRPAFELHRSAALTKWQALIGQFSLPIGPTSSNGEQFATD